MTAAALLLASLLAVVAAPAGATGPLGVAQPAGCTSAGLAPSVGSPQHPGTSVTFTASSAGCPSAEYRYFVQPPGGSWTAQTGYMGSTWAWNTSALGTGIYGVGVWARNAGSAASYEAYWIGTFQLTTDRCTTAFLSTPTPNGQPPGSSVSFQAGASPCTGAQFRFWLLPHYGSWSMVQDYGAGSWTWNTSGYAAGTYEVGVWARMPGSSNAYDAYGITTYVLGNTGACDTVGLQSIGVPSPQPPGAGPVAFSAFGCNVSNLVYQFWLLPPGGSWRVVQAYSTSQDWGWVTIGYPTGTYQVGVWARAPYSGASYDAFNVTTFVLDVGSCSAAQISVNPSSPQAVGTSVTVSATSTNGDPIVPAATCSSPQYEFWILPPSGTWQSVGPYSSDNSFTIATPGGPAGPYRLGVWARQSGSSTSNDSYAILTFWMT